MPTGNCRFPEHHSGGSSAGPPLGLLLAIAAGALIITHVHAVLVTLAVVAALAVAGAAVVMMVHSHRAEPYDAPWSDLEPQDAVTESLFVTVEVQLQHKVEQLERQLAERQAIAPVTHQHLHLHGLTGEEMAEVVSRRAAIED